MSKTSHEICFFCQREIPENSDTYYLCAYRVCPECHEVMQNGIPVVAIQNTPVFQGQRVFCRIQDETTSQAMYPTGEWCQFSEEAISRLFGPERLEAGKASGFLFVSPDVMKGIQDIYKTTMMPEELSAQNPEDSGIPINDVSI